MSANNELLIFKIKNEWAVFENSCVDNNFKTPKTSKDALFKSKNKLKAIEFANEYCNNEMVEYGFLIVG